MFTTGSPTAAQCVRTLRRRITCSAVAEVPVEAHVVKDGESLWSIAHQYGIKEANRELFRPGARCGTSQHIRDPTVVIPGERLKVPMCCCPPVPDQLQGRLDMHKTDEQELKVHEATCTAGEIASVASVPSASQIQADEFSPEVHIQYASTAQMALPTIQLPKSVPVQGIAIGTAGTVVAAVLAHIYYRVRSSPVQIMDSPAERISSMTGVNTTGTGVPEVSGLVSSKLHQVHVEQPAEALNVFETAGSSYANATDGNLHEAGEEVAGATAFELQNELQSSDAQPDAQPTAADSSSTLDASPSGSVSTAESSSGKSGALGLPGSTTSLALVASMPTVFRTAPKLEHVVSADDIWPDVDEHVVSNDGVDIDGHVDCIAEGSDTSATHSGEEINENVPDAASEQHSLQKSYSVATTVLSSQDADWEASENTEVSGTQDNDAVDDNARLEESGASPSSTSSVDPAPVSNSEDVTSSTSSEDVTSSTDSAVLTPDQDDISAEDWRPKESSADPKGNDTHMASSSTFNALEGSSMVCEVNKGAVQNMMDTTGGNNGTPQGPESAAVASTVRTALDDETQEPPKPQQSREGAHDGHRPASLDDSQGVRTEFGVGSAEVPSNSNFDGMSFLSHTIGFMARSTGLLNGNSFLGTMAARGGDQPVASPDSVFQTKISDDWEQLEDCLWTLVKNGNTVDAQQQGELEELVLQMESLASMDEPKTPQRELLEMQALTGTWKLLLSTDVQTQSVLRAVSMIPFVSLGEVVQRIDTRKREVETRVTLDSPTKIDVSMRGTFRLKSTKRALTEHHTCVIDCAETPQLFPGMQVPQTVTVGDEHDIDISIVQGTVDMIQSTVHDAIQLATPQEIQVGNKSSIWLNTVVRDNVRICRGADSEILVFQRCQ